MEPTESNIRVPGILVPSYQKLISTEEGKAAMKRIRVECGVCRATRFYSIHRGITRISGVVACEACRQFYQRFNKQPFSVTCSREGRCFEQDEIPKTFKCKACWIAQILRRCPVSSGLYNRFSAQLPADIKADLPRQPTSLDDISPEDRGGLGLEIYLNNDWVDVTDDKGENVVDTNDLDDGFEPDVGLEFEAEEEIVDDPAPVASPADDTASTSVSEIGTRRKLKRLKKSRIREEMDPDDREETSKDSASVMSSLLEGLHVNNQFMENFNPKNSERVRRKKKKVQYFNSTGRGKRDCQTVHAPDGKLAGTGKDLCDCLHADCPGCHFPCPKCGSGKCGNECRISRKWYYDSVEVEGTKLRWHNEYMKK